ncbi:cell division protein ZapA [Roseateles sp.]|uniref:cell division protein ZapA n=1 Tax=Roseateles sp. TaxID=1971397 RepID=UPI003BAD9004
MKQMEVTIMGQSYLLGCPEGGEAALTSAVAQVDREMSTIRDAGKVKARERIAVLAALNLAYQLAGTAPSTVVAGPIASPELDALVKRLDDALGHDGQLI